MASSQTDSCGATVSNQFVISAASTTAISDWRTSWSTSPHASTMQLMLCPLQSLAGPKAGEQVVLWQMARCMHHVLLRGHCPDSCCVLVCRIYARQFKMIDYGLAKVSSGFGASLVQVLEAIDKVLNKMI